MLRSLFVLLFACVAISTQALAGAFVADEMRLEVADKYIEAKAGRIAYVEIGQATAGSIYEVDAYADNRVYDDISVYVCSEPDLKLFLAERNSQCRGKSQEKGLVKFTVRTQHSGRHFLVVDNTYSVMVKKKVNAKVMLVTRMSQKMKQELVQGLSQASQSIQNMFVVDEFDFRMEPCGKKNAYSKNATGDITMCSELVFDLLKRKMPGALDGIMYHELGHTLLNLWGLPGWDNEETVDEFGMVMLYLKGEQEKAFDWMRWNAETNEEAELQSRRNRDVRHPLSAQRVRNQKRILNNPGEVISRWNNLLYPHMTKAGLRYLQNTSPKYVDRALMEKYLRNSRVSDNQTSRQLAPPPQRSSSPSWGPVN